MTQSPVVFETPSEVFDLCCVLGLAERFVGLKQPYGENAHPDEDYHQLVKNVRAKIEAAGQL